MYNIKTCYYKVIDDKTKKVDIGDGSNESYYKSIGMIKGSVEQAYDGQWYLEGYAQEESLDLIKKTKWAEIQAASKQSREVDIVAVNGMEFSISEQAKINLTSVTLMGQVSGSVQYFEKTGTLHTFAIADWMPIALAIGQGIASAEAKYYTYENMIKAAETVEEVRAITWQD